jgi:phosphate transport system substrate-binding protein
MLRKSSMSVRLEPYRLSRGIVVAVFFAALSLPFSTACGRSSSPGGSDPLTLAGSTSVQPFAEKLAEDYESEHHDLLINVQGGGSTAGVKAAGTGTAQIGMSSRELKSSEKGLTRIVIAHDGIAIIVHRDNPVSGLDRKAIAHIFAGLESDWAPFGWTGPIHYVTREEGSGTRGAFEEMVMGKLSISPRALVQDSNGAVREIVAGDRRAIGYISLGLVDRRIKALSVDGVAPTVEAIRSQRYAVVRPFLFLTRSTPTGAAAAFVDFVLGPRGQAILAAEGLVPVN